MDKKILTKLLFIFLSLLGTCRAAGCAKSLETCKPAIADTNATDVILQRLSRQSAKLQSYQAQIGYIFRQPLLESQTLRKGMLYYRKQKGRSNLCINFRTLKQDDEKQQQYLEKYIFDGVWFTHIDYTLRQIKRYQQAEPNQPIDAFELAGRNFPVIGFSRPEGLKKEFEIKIAEQQGKDAERFIKLHLKARPDSMYSEDYTSIDFWIDKELNLPARIIAVSTEEDVYEIRLLKARVNQKIKSEVFDWKVPEGFGKPQVIPLKTEKK